MNIQHSKVFPLSFVALFLTAAVMDGCRKSLYAPDERAKYVQVCESGLRVLPWPKQMEALFGNGYHFITDYGIRQGPLQWNSVVYFGGRYELEMRVEVEIDYSDLKVVRAVTSPKFELHEMSDVTIFSNGSATAGYTRQWNLDESQWNKLVAAKGDWSVLGIPHNDISVPNFDAFVKAWSKDIIPVPH